MASLGLHLEWTTIQKWRAHLWEIFEVGLKWLNPLLVKAFDMDLWGRHVPWIRILRWKDTPLIWASPWAGSLYEDVEEGRFCSVPCSCLTSKSIPLLTLEPISLGFQCLLRISWVIQSPGQSNFWIRGLSVHSQTLLDQHPHPTP